MLASDFLDENNIEHEALEIPDLNTDVVPDEVNGRGINHAGSITAKDNGDYGNGEEKKFIGGWLSIVGPTMVLIVAADSPECYHRDLVGGNYVSKRPVWVSSRVAAVLLRHNDCLRSRLDNLKRA